MKIPGQNAHPVEVINAYHQLAANVKKQTQREINIEDSMAYEIQCLRKEKNNLEQQLRLQTVETRKAQKQISDLQKQLQMQSKMSYSMILPNGQSSTRMTASGFQTSTTLTTNLKNKCKELLQNNKQLSDKIQELQNSMKYQQLTQLEKYFKVYYEKYQQEHSKNQNLMEEIKDLQQENIYLKNTVDTLRQNSIKQQQNNEQLHQDFDLVNNQDEMIQLQRYNNDIQNQMETSEQSSDFDIGNAYNIQQMQQQMHNYNTQKQSNKQSDQSSKLPQFNIYQQQNKLSINQSNYHQSSTEDKIFFNTLNQSSASQTINEQRNIPKVDQAIQQQTKQHNELPIQIQKVSSTNQIQHILNNNQQDEEDQQMNDKINQLVGYTEEEIRKQFKSIDLEKQLKDSIKPKQQLTLDEINEQLQIQEQPPMPTFEFSNNRKSYKKSDNLNQIRNGTFQDINYESPVIQKQDIQSSTTSVNVNSHMFSNNIEDKQEVQENTESITVNSQIFTNKNSESNNNNNEDTVASLDVNSKMFN